MYQFKRARYLSTLLIVSTALLLFALEASAEELAALSFEGDGVDSDVQRALMSTLEGTADASADWELVGFDATGRQLDAVLLDCFTEECLTRIGESVGAPAGLSVEMSAEADIYDWTISVWDLRNGTQIGEKKGICELCGRAELERTFKGDVDTLLASAELPAATSDEAQVKLHVITEPDDAEIYVDGEQVGEGEWSQMVEPGTYRVQLRHDDYSGIKETVVVSEGADGPVVFRAHMSERDPAPVRAAPSQGPVDRMGDARDTYGWLGVGAGGVMLGTGAYLTAIDGEPAGCEPGVAVEDCPEVYATGPAGMTFGVLGAALITGGATLLVWELLAGDASSPAETGAGGDAPTMSISPSVGADGGGVLLNGSF